MLLPGGAHEQHYGVSTTAIAPPTPPPAPDKTGTMRHAAFACPETISEAEWGQGGTSKVMGCYLTGPLKNIDNRTTLGNSNLVGCCKSCKITPHDKIRPPNMLF